MRWIRAPPRHPDADAPPSRDLTNLKGVRVMLFSAPKTDPDVIYIGLNDRDKAWHDLYKLKISTGERTLIRKNTDRIAGWIFDLQGNLRLAQRVQDNGRSGNPARGCRAVSRRFIPAMSLRLAMWSSSTKTASAPIFKPTRATWI